MGVGSGKVSPVWSLLWGLGFSSVLNILNTLYFFRSGRHLCNSSHTKLGCYVALPVVYALWAWFVSCKGRQAWR